MRTTHEFDSRHARPFYVQTAKRATWALITLLAVSATVGSIPASAGTVTHTYDAMDRVVSRTDAVGAVERFAYDGMGNLVRYTDRKGQAHTFTYDPLNRLVAVTYADGSTARFTYDAGGRLTEATDSLGGTLQHRYDLLDRLVSQTTDLGTLQYTYDALGRRASMTVPSQTPVTYNYDAGSRLTQVSQGARIVGLQYDAAGRRTRLSLPDGVSTDYQYDAVGRVTAMTFRNAAGVLGDLTYAYDSAGNRVATGGSFARTGLPLAAFTGVYDAANRQLIFGDRQLTYDANGGVTSITEPSGTTILTWDARNRLVGMAGPGLTASFVYDVFSRRIKKTVNGSTTQYVYDGFTVVQEIRDGVTVNYLTGLGLDEPWIRDGNELYLADGLGTVIALVDSAGAVTARYTYEPFGAVSQQMGTTMNPLQYTARENDGTGFYYYRARYYHPTLQRFVSEDPIGITGGDVNLYAYVWNSPTIFVDPLGLWGFGASVSGTGEVGVGAAGAAGTGGFGGAIIGSGVSSASVVGFATGGGFAGGPGYGPSSPSRSKSADAGLDCGNNFALGGYGGGGLSFFFTTATKPSQLAGPFKVYSFNAGWGLRLLSLQYAVGADGTKVFSYGGPLPGGIPTGGGYGVSVSSYCTNTGVVSWP